MSLRERLGWNSFFEQQIARFTRPDLLFARIVEEQRGLYRIDGDAEGWVEVSGRFRHDATGAADFPAVGDWVAVESGIIHHRLERSGTVSRAAAGRVGGEQVLAANVDVIFLVTALSGDLNVRRLERYLTMVWDAGALPVVVLNKSDLCADPVAAMDAVRARLPMIDIVTVCALDPAGLDALSPWLRPQRTVALLGSSGVGKSTLVNRLVGAERLRTAAVSAEDGKGRHTTTARQLVELPGGALLIDTPGMRELQPWADESAIAGAFDDVTALAGGCRFADCAHGNEPGCAVREAVEGGRLDADRLENYRRLGREAEYQSRRHDKAAAAEHKRKWKQMHRAARAMYRDRDRR